VNGLTRIHEWLSAGARANGISEDGILRIAEEACIAVQEGTVQCWDSNGMPVRGGIPIPKQPTLGPYITDEAGNEWLKSKGYLWKWKHVREPLSQPPGEISAKKLEPWVDEARRRAREIIDVAYERDLYPNMTTVADRIAEQFRKEGIHGKSGKPLAGAYIKRHALKGIFSRKPPRKHAEITRGK